MSTPRMRWLEVERPRVGSDPSDEALWTLAGHGDREAFAVLFERHVRRVWNHAYRLTGSRDDAEDVTANTFLVAWRRCPRVQLIRNDAIPWLLAVASNLARETRRAALRREKLLRKLNTPEYTVDAANETVAPEGIEARAEKVRLAMASLPLAQRRAVELCVVAELPTADAAAALGVSEGAVRSNLSRGRARLRAILAPGDGGCHGS